MTCVSVIPDRYTRRTFQPSRYRGLETGAIRAGNRHRSLR